MLADTYDDTYFDRMRSSLGDKARIVDCLPNALSCVIDVGQAVVPLAELIRLAGHHIAAIDGFTSTIATSYLQPRYADGLSDLIGLTDIGGSPLPLPGSNMFAGNPASIQEVGQP